MTVATNTHVRFEENKWLQGITGLCDLLRQKAIKQDAFSTLRDRELHYLQRQVRAFQQWHELYTDLTVLAQRGRVKIKSETARVYLDMQHEAFPECSGKAQWRDDATRLTSFLDLVYWIKQVKRTALIGGPGSGKTTTMQRLGLELAQQAITDETAPLPILVNLGAYGSFEGGGVQDFVVANFPGFDLEQYLSQGRAFLLFDGLNEIPHDRLSGVEEWIRMAGHVPLVVSCRRHYYVEKKLPLRRIDILPLSVDQIRTFIGNYLEDDDRDRLFWALAGKEAREAWIAFSEPGQGPLFPTTSKPAEVELGLFASYWHGDTSAGDDYDVHRQRIRTIQQALRADGKLPGMLDVATNPFLLFAAIQVYVDKTELPSNKSELLTLFVNLLFEKARKGASVGCRLDVAWTANDDACAIEDRLRHPEEGRRHECPCELGKARST